MTELLDPAGPSEETGAASSNEVGVSGLALVDAGEPQDALNSADESVVLGETNRVKVYSVVCGSGATSSFYTLEGGFRLNARFGFYRANGVRLGLSSIFYWDGVIGPNVGRSVRVNGYLPAGTKEVRGFWFFGEPGSPTGPTWWKGTRANC
jgi:hypothetical protein